MKFRIVPISYGHMQLQVMTNEAHGNYPASWKVLGSANYADRDTLREVAQAHKDATDRAEYWAKIPTEEFEL